MDNSIKRPRSEDLVSTSEQNKQQAQRKRHAKSEPIPKEIERIQTKIRNKICSDQVIVDLKGCVKELVENAIDAQAAEIVIRLTESGSETIEVRDNGKGIQKSNFSALASRHATSKIERFEDIHSSLDTLGFRGEALNSLCALAEMKICTRSQNDDFGTVLTFDSRGNVLDSSLEAREEGTTVYCNKLFSRLPVRRQQYLKHMKPHLSSLINLLQSYALIQGRIKFLLTNEITLRGKKQIKTLLGTTGGKEELKESARSLFGSTHIDNMIEFHVDLSDEHSREGKNISIEGLISRPEATHSTKEMQYFFINQRPINSPSQIARAITELYKQFSSRHQIGYIMHLTLPEFSFDINVSPDKRSAFITNEKGIAFKLREHLTKILTPTGQLIVSHSISAPFGKAPEHIGVNRITPVNPTMCKVKSRDGTKPFIDMPQQHWIIQSTPTVEAENRNPVHEKPDNNLFPSDTISLQQLPTNENIMRSYEDNNILLTHGNNNIIIPDGENNIITTQGDHGVITPDGNNKTLIKDTATDSSLISNPDPVSPILNTAIPNRDDISTTRARTTLTGKPMVTTLYQGNKNMISSNSTNFTVLVPESDIKVYIDSLSASSIMTVVWNTDTLAQQVRVLNSRTGLHKINDDEVISTNSRKQLTDLLCLSSETKDSRDKSTAETDKMKSFPLMKSMFRDMRICGQFNKGFIIVKLRLRNLYDNTNFSDIQSEWALFIIDQHASDEKIRFESMNRNAKFCPQPLVTELKVQLTPSQEHIVCMHRKILLKNGFHPIVNENGECGRRVSLRALPSLNKVQLSQLDFIDLLNIIGDISNDVSEESKFDEIPRPRRVWTALASKACRTAIMIGDSLKYSEMATLVWRLSDLSQPWNCPHGRPVLRHIYTFAN